MKRSEAGDRGAHAVLMWLYTRLLNVITPGCSNLLPHLESETGSADFYLDLEAGIPVLGKIQQNFSLSTKTVLERAVFGNLFSVLLCCASPQTTSTDL